MQIPSELKYTKEHEWIRVEAGNAYAGITDYAQKELGEIVYVDIPTKGKTISKGEVFGTIEAVKTVSDLYMPASGKIAEVNSDLEDSPESVNEDPYGKGWIVKIELTNPEEAETLLSCEEYESFIN